MASESGNKFRELRVIIALFVIAFVGFRIVGHMVTARAVEQTDTRPWAR